MTTTLLASKPPATRSGRPGALVLLVLASALGGLGQSVAGSAGALLADRVAGPAASGLPQTVLVVGAGAAAWLLSRVTRRWGRGPALGLGLLVAAVGGGVVAYGAALGSLTVLLGGHLLLGAGNTAVMLSRYAAADLADAVHRGRAMGTLLTGVTIGAVAGPNLLDPADRWGRAFGLSELAGPYVLAAAVFVVAALVLGALPKAPATPGMALASTPGSHRGTTATGLLVLGLANLVMVGVMTAAPLHLHHEGAGLRLIGVVISVHIAGMFAPSPLSGWLTDRYGAPRTAVLSGLVLTVASLVAASAATATSMTLERAVFTLAMAGLGLGWNLGLVAGSAMLTLGVPEAARPAREGLGEVAMSVAASGAGAVSGLVLAAAGYAWVGGAGAGVAVVLALAALRARTPD